METNRRSFFAALLAAPSAIRAALKSRKPKPKSTSTYVIEECGYHRLCFNCRKLFRVPTSKWCPEGFDVGLTVCTNDPPPIWLTDGSVGIGSDQRFRVYLCDSCIEAIQHCATCGRLLENRSGELRLYHSGNLDIHPCVVPPVIHAACRNTWNPSDYINCRVYRDLIVADCPGCYLKRSANVEFLGTKDLKL